MSNKDYSSDIGGIALASLILVFVQCATCSSVRRIAEISEAMLEIMRELP